MSTPATAPSASTPALQRVPEAFVRAEVASFPLASLESFRLAVIDLDPQLADRNKTLRLWRACEERFVEHASGWSLDRIVAARDRSWFGGGRNVEPERNRHCVPMHSYLRGLCADHLEQHPGTTDLESGCDLDRLQVATRYRWLTFSLPEDLLLAASKSEPPPQRIDLGSPLLIRRLLDRGVAEIHHHVGAGMDFPLLWASALASLADPGLRADALAGPGMPFDEGKGMVPWLLAAALARIVLAEFLIRCETPDPPKKLASFLEHFSSSPSWSGRRWYLLKESLEAALAPADDHKLPDFHALQDLYGELHPQAPRGKHNLPQCMAEVWHQCDPIATRLNLSTRNAGERWFVRHGLSYLETGAASTPDKLFARLFWQIQRLRCQYYRCVVQRPMTAGLQWFTRFYSRIGKLRQPLSAARPEISYRIAGGGHPIRALEIRTCPETTAVELAEEMLGIVESWRRVLESTRGLAETPELGVILHFAKERDPKKAWAGGRPPAFWAGTHAEPLPTNSLRLGGRYSDYFCAQLARARAVADLLQAVPRMLWLIRGIDVADDEIGIPTWVLVPLYRYLQEQSDVVSADPRSGGAPRLRATAHAGEDFRHLMEGLRRLFEVMAYLLSPTAGRLGHATALGIEPRGWAQTVGSVLMPQEDRLWDLVFEWRLYSDPRIPAELTAAEPAGRLGRLGNRIRELAHNVFHRNYEPQHLAEAYHVLHSFLVPPLREKIISDGIDVFDRALRTLPLAKVRYYDKVQEILHAYLRDQNVFERGQEPIEIPIDDSEVAALVAVQDALRRGAGMRGIVVEVNPSSNLLIGDLLDLRHHPLLRLFPPDPESGPPAVPIAIGSDDPLTFSTNLLREYTLMFETARAAGYSVPVVQNWLETIRQTSMDARFTLAWQPSPLEMTDRLLADLEAFLRIPHRERRSRG